MHDDPFSDLLRLVRARSVISGGLVAGGAWAMTSPPTDMIKYWGVVRGRAELAIEGEAAPIRFAAGDFFLLSEPRALRIASDPAAEPVDLAEAARGREGAIIRLGQGDDFFMIGGKVELGEESGKLLRDELPRFIHIPAAARQARMLQLLLEQLVREREDELPGAGLASAQLAQLMFIHILRACTEDAGALPSGWLRAVSDRRLAPAVRRMHAEPGRAWQLEELARTAAMSRASFAACFKAVAGMAPMAYLTQWRMRLARQALRDTRTPVGLLAQSLGYGSESAFSNAFKRVTGVSPKGYRNRARSPSPFPDPAAPSRLAG